VADIKQAAKAGVITLWTNAWKGGDGLYWLNVGMTKERAIAELEQAKKDAPFLKHCLARVEIEEETCNS
jgi:hypothetical protein